MSGITNEQHESKAKKLRNWRMFKDTATRFIVGSGGGAVIVSLLLIFVYLVGVVLPMFVWPSAHPVATYSLPGNPSANTLQLSLEEQNQIATRISDDGSVVFFNTKDGSIVDDFMLPSNATITAFSAGFEAAQTSLFGFDDGSALFIKQGMKTTYPNNIRVLTPQLLFPLGNAPIDVDDEGQAITLITGQVGESEATIVAKLADNSVRIVNFTKEESFLSDEATWESQSALLPLNKNANVKAMELINDQSGLYLVTEDNRLAFYDLRNRTEPELVDTVDLSEHSVEADQIELLAGGISLLITDKQGEISQWFMVRNNKSAFKLQLIRRFDQGAQITSISAEHARKGFIATDSKGDFGVYHATSQQQLMVKKASSMAITRSTISPRASAALFLDAQQKLHFWTIDNEYPEVSVGALWSKIWYEGYEEPEYTWQSSSSSNDFEPKFSLTPLAVGTVKAAFYALLFAIPLSILGAAYTAYFMTPSMRKLVKPSIEIMEALPTVILGFLAGLWLAPFMEKHLPGFFALLILLPVGTILASFLWTKLPDNIRLTIPDGWQAALLIPVVAGISWAAFSASPLVEDWFFGGDMRGYLTNELGIPFDQRNSLVVGIAMGFAVIPTIFSIAEDAIFSVPKHLTFGSLALGATTWQSLTRVVLLTASPGIFSAVMIGLGRAVGETMIVLMATGNTPVMDMSIFQGMRTLSANIAVEMPESELGSSHYRILFLAALVLFVFTFFFNTIAELVRQRLRKKYSSL